MRLRLPGAARGRRAWAERGKTVCPKLKIGKSVKTYNFGNVFNQFPGLDGSTPPRMSSTHRQPSGCEADARSRLDNWP
jgi:hypothetical protein